MNTFLVTLIPIVLIILLGYLLKRTQFLADTVWLGIEKITYYLLFPALLIRSLGTQNIEGTPWREILFLVTLVLAIASVVLLLLRYAAYKTQGATFSSVYQGGVRFNTYIALAIAQGVYGSEGLALASLAAGFMIVLINLLCISAFSLFVGGAVKGVMSFTKDVFVNPLILACFAGWVLSLSGIGVSGVADRLLEILGRASLPLGLLAVGAALKPEMIRAHFRPVLEASLVQFLVKPLSVALLLPLSGLEGAAAAVLVILFVTPTAPSAYILARQLGGDTAAMASIISFQTLLAFFLMPLFMSWLIA